MLEVLIAIAVFSIGTTFVLQALSYTSRMTGLSADITKAVFLSADVLQELQAKEKFSLLDSASPGLTDSKDRFEYSYTLQPHSFLDNTLIVEYTIAWKRQSRNEDIPVITYLRK